jgi:RhtB (resistance to homoserine/threonine) family protein
MIEARTFCVFLLAALVVVIAPGPDILYVLSRSLSADKRSGLTSAFAIATGDVLHTALVVLGLAALLQASTMAFLVLKYFGALYLIYLGVKTIRDNTKLDLASFAPSSKWRVFRQGILTNLSNPKAIFFYATFLPQFVNPSHGHAHAQLVVLGITLAFLDVIFLVTLVAAASKVSVWLTRKPQNAHRLRLGTGTLLLGLGVRLAFAERS